VPEVVTGYQMKKVSKISVIIPLLNEEENLSLLHERLTAKLILVQPKEGESPHEST
jgi:hypothetical protein